MINGTIARLRLDRGFGFLRADDGIEYFFHATGCFDAFRTFHTLQVGEAVTFELLTSARGPYASGVRRIST